MSERRALRASALALAAAVVMVLTACTSSRPTSSSTGTGSGRPVLIASFNFSESSVLAEIYAQSLEHAGIPVRREFDLGPREIVRPAMQRGAVDLVPEYLGTALTSADPTAVVEGRPAPELLAELRRVAARWHLMVLQPASASDQNGFAVLEITARRWHLRTLSDLAKVAPRMVLGGGTECPSRPLCLLGLQRVYGIHFGRFEAFDDETQRFTALEQGVIDVEVTFTTDPRLLDGSIVLLRDDRGLQPVESVVPIVTTRAVQEYGPRLTQALDAVSAQLDSRSLTFLNWRVAVAGKNPRAEAHNWLQRHKLLGN
jgi:osmoprotectant transport system substrate-binding protein